MKPARLEFNRRRVTGLSFTRVSSDAIANFERLPRAGRDAVLLRFSPGGEYLRVEAPAVAASHLTHVSR
jgi:hypothetical protein